MTHSFGCNCAECATKYYRAGLNMTTLTDEQINVIASNIYGTRATAQEVRFARALLSASKPAAPQSVTFEELATRFELEAKLSDVGAYGYDRTMMRDLARDFFNAVVAPQPSPSAVVLDDERAAFERALFELVNKIDAGLDTGDLLKDAKRASAALDSILSGGDLVACAHEYFRDSGDRYEKSIEFRIGWNACLDAIAQARAAFPLPVAQTRALTDRLIAAIEGECDGLMIGQEQASSILAYLQYGVEMYDTQFLRRDAERYRKLRDADINAIHKGGVFAGLTPDNVVINGEDLDIAVDLLIDAATHPASGATE